MIHVIGMTLFRNELSFSMSAQPLPSGHGRLGAGRPRAEARPAAISFSAGATAADITMLEGARRRAEYSRLAPLHG